MSNKMWGGRFTERPDAIMEEINVSIDVDRHLYAQDIAASKAHAAMLSAQGIITANDAKNIAKGLDTILSEIGKGSFDFKRALEDIHMNVESRLAELIGPAAGRLHTARSRNDQIATDFRLFVRDTIDETEAALAMFQQALDPAGNLWITVLIALVPLFALLFMLAVLRMTAWLASIFVGLITIPIGVLVWQAPFASTLKAY